ncbi:MAG: hypothetical protein AAF581_04505 [Planctomycetota bacterium]
MTTRRLLGLCAVLCLGLLTSCNNGGGGGGARVGAAPAAPTQPEAEPNDLFDDAELLDSNVAGIGDLAESGDIDVWAFEATAGAVYRIELQAFILDFGGWSETNNELRFEVYDTDRDQICRHDNAVFLGRAIDLDIPHLMIDEDGTHYVRLTARDNNSGGRYSIRCVPVEMSELQYETEAYGESGGNDTIDTAQLVESGTIWGYHVDDESDYYAFEISAPSLVTMEMMTYRNGFLATETRYYDPYLRFYDATGAQLATNDDAYFYDSTIWVYIDQPGTYYARVHEYSGSVADGEYFLGLDIEPVSASPEATDNNLQDTAAPIQLGDFVANSLAAGEQAYYSLSLSAGDLLRLHHYSGSIHTGSDASVVLHILDEDGTAVPYRSGFFAHRWLALETGHYTVRVSANVAAAYAFRVERIRQSTFEVEADDTANETPLSAAPVIGTGNGRSGAIDFTDDADVYRFTGQPNHLMSFSVHAGNSGDSGARQLNGHGSSLRPRLRLFDADGNVLQEVASDSIRGAQRCTNVFATAELAFESTDAGTYYLEVTSLNSLFGESYFYLLERTR